VIKVELFTERLKLKDVLPEIATDIAKEYDLQEEDLELVRKNNPLRPEDIKIEDGERAAVRYVNTADVDRDNEIVMPDGLQTKDFLKSPSVLYAHNYRGLPIGKDIWLKLIKGKGWLAKTVYAKHELATDVYNLVKDKFLNTNSIGFIPLESVKPDNKKWDKVKDKLISEYGIKEKLIDKVKRIYTNSILLEHSDVPIPSNINALNIAVGKGFIKSDQLIKDLEIEIIDEEKEDISKKGLIPLPGGEVVIPSDQSKEVELSEEDKEKLEEGLKDVKKDKVEEVDVDKLKEGIEEEGEAIKLEDVEKPYPSEHACRIRQPGGFQPGSFRRMTRRSDGKEYAIIMGRLKGETTLTEQAYRYGIKVWTVSEARKHCKDHKGILFEPATGKEEEDILEKGVIPFKETPKAPEGEGWDAGAEVKKASGNATRLKTMHTWVDSGADNFDADERQWYKLPHHKGDGTQAVVWRGVAAGMAVLFGARGGVDIPGGDRKGCYNHLVKHYKQFDKEPPEFREYTEEEIKYINRHIEDKKIDVDLILDMADFGEDWVDTLRILRSLKEEDKETIDLTNIVTTVKIADLEEFKVIVEKVVEQGKEIERLKLEIEGLELKTGAVLNRKNKTDLTNAQKLIQNVLDSASTAEEGKETYNCECIKCGYKMTSDKHCDTLKCPKCGGDMRRAERPGPGKEIDEIEIEEDIDIEIEDDEDNGTEGKEETIDISEEEIKEIISEVLNGKVDKLADTLKKEVSDNFKKMTGKVM